MADLLGQDLLQATTNTAAHAAHTVAQTKHAVMQAAVTCPPLEGVTYMNTAIAVGIAALIAAGIGYLVGHRGIAKTQADLTNAIKQIQALPQTIQATPAKVEQDVKEHLPKL